jgi:hypothetical protein
MTVLDLYDKQHEALLLVIEARRGWERLRADQRLSGRWVRQLGLAVPHCLSRVAKS